MKHFSRQEEATILNDEILALMKERKFGGIVVIDYGHAFTWSVHSVGFGRAIDMMKSVIGDLIKRLNT